MEELIDELRSQKSNLQGKLEEMEKKLEENELEMVTLKAKVKENQFQVNFGNYLNGIHLNLTTFLFSNLEKQNRNFKSLNFIKITNRSNH